jgi:DNA-binding beta-propeller fold protein YncE
MRNQISVVLIVITFTLGCSKHLQMRNDHEVIVPGQYEGYVLLPNGWKLTPIGQHVAIGELPLNMITTQNEKYALTSNSGKDEHSISVIELKTMQETQRIKVNKTWRGMAFNEDESMLFVSGGNNDVVYMYTFTSGTLTLVDSISLKNAGEELEISVAGLDYSKNKKQVLAVSKGSNSLYACDVIDKKVTTQITLPGKCYDIKINHAQTHAYVSIWENAQVAEVDLQNFEIIRKFAVGDHPCELLITTDDSWLFVTNANNNSTSLIDLKQGKEVEKIISSLTPEAPYGSTPNAICFNNDETVLLVANADNNYLALFDISDKGQSKSLGFIPTAWYPTSVKFLKQSQQVLVACGKGLSSLPNPKGPMPTLGKGYTTQQYIGSMFKGTVSIFDLPEPEKLAPLSKKVYDNTPYISQSKTEGHEQSIIPSQHNGKQSDKIKHVFYIIKENRTYDQVFGDIERANGDPALCLFGKKITPNQHKLVEEFTLFDNFYVDAEVSADGHNWSTAAYASDYVEKTWPTLYGGRGGRYDYEGSEHIAASSAGYIWDAVLKNELSLRNYGNFVRRIEAQNDLYVPWESYLKPHTCQKFPGYDLKISDITRYEQWALDFEKLLERDAVPNFNIIRFPNDHTAGTRAGWLTPQAYVAQNDYAVGLFVEKVSKSKIWEKSIIFILMDDAQNGSDHVDAHRSVLLVIGPYVRRNFIDHTMYSTTSVLKTIELILGLDPLTQFDLSATPIINPISDEPNFESFTAISPLIDIEEKNSEDAYGAKRSEEFNLAVENAIPDIEFNEIVWKAIRGPDSVMPPPVRSAFVRISADRD